MSMVVSGRVTTSLYFRLSGNEVQCRFGIRQRSLLMSRIRLDLRNAIRGQAYGDERY